jgi:AcrR family transcriptional regulator
MTSQTGPAATVARRGPGRPRNTDSEATKLRILDAAIESFGAGGFGGTSSQTIAAAAGVAAPTVYHHFANKRQLYVAAFQHSVDIAWRGYGEAAAATGTSFLDELVAVVHAAVGVMQRRPAMTMLAIRAALDLGRGDLDRTVPDGVLAAMAARAVARGELAVDDVVNVGPVVEVVLWGVSVVGRGDTDLQQRCAEAIDLVLHGRLVQRPTRRRRTG